jgi:hypothetical protein
LKKWSAGTGFNRRHQDFQISRQIVRLARILNELLSRRRVAPVAPSDGRLRPVAGRE